MAFDPSTATLAPAAAFDPSSATLAADDTAGAPPAAPTAPPETVGRVVGLGDRALIQGIGQLADTPGALISLADKAGGTVHDYIRGLFGLSPNAVPAIQAPTGGTQTAAALSNLEGLPTPQTPGERIGSSAVSGLPAAIVAPEAPVAGVLSAAAGGAAAQTTAELGGGPVAQTIAGAVGGGLAGGVRGAIAREGDAAFGAAQQRLQAEGIPLNMAQASGSKLAQHIDRASQMVSTGAENFADQQGTAFNRAVLKRIGVTDTTNPGVTAATPEVLNDARSRIKAVMDGVAARSNVSLDTDLSNDIKDVTDTLPGRVPASEQGPLLTNIKDLTDAATANGGAIPGQVLQRVRSNLAALSKSPQLGDSASDLQEAIDNAVSRSASPEDAAALAQARQQYRALKQIEPAVDQNGDISPRKLMASLSTQKNRNQVLYGQGDQSLTTLARDARTVLPDSLGNSGTPERFIPTLTVLEALASGHPIQAAVKAVAGVAGIGTAARALRNQSVVNNLPKVTGGAASGAKSGVVPGAAGAGLNQSP